MLLAGFMIHFTLGSFATFGNVIPYIVSFIRERSHPQSLRYTDATMALAVQMAGQGIGMIIGGWLEKRFGPRLITLIGGLLMSLGVLLSFLTIKVSFWLLLITYGVMYGIGNGIAYVPPVVCAIRWLPKWKGVATGIVVCGFGLSAFVFDPMQTLFINYHNLKPNLAPYKNNPGEKYFTQSDVLDQVPTMFLLLGGVFTALQLSALFLVNPSPPDDEQTEALTELISDGTLFDDENVKDSQPLLKESLMYLLKSPNFYILWLMFFCVGIVVVFIGALYKAFGLEQVTSDDYFLAITGSVSAIFNCVGRIPWGLLVDVTDYKFGFIFQGTVMTCLLATLYAASVGGKVLYFIWICAIFYCLGGYFAFFPIAAVQSFGLEHVSMNYGILSSALASGGVVGTLISVWLVQTINWYGVFFVVTSVHIAEIILALMLRSDK